jgi:hypothetical protein
MHERVMVMDDIFGWMLQRDEIPVHQVVERIESLNRALVQFWKAAHGWAPLEAAGLLSKSRLDWQVSLSSPLHLWRRELLNSLTDGELILAWANLGSLIEGTLKLFLSVYYEDFQKDVVNLKKAGAYDHKKKVCMSPDGLTLDRLRKYILAATIFTADSNTPVQLVQDRRNAIHAFKDCPIGSGAEFWEAVRAYLDLLHDVEGRPPYP